MKKPLDKDLLKKLYIKEKKSVSEIAFLLKETERKVSYWLAKHGVPRRTISEAVYVKINSGADPFSYKNIKGETDAFLYGLGLGLYWGEGTKKNKFAVRVGNSDPKLIKAFLCFLSTFYEIDKSKLRFELQIFDDVDERKVRNHWLKILGINKKQLYKTRITKSNTQGTYKNKNSIGVLTIHFGNKKLRDSLCGVVEKMQSLDYDALYSTEVASLIKNHNNR